MITKKEMFWKELSVKTIIKNKWIHLLEQKVQMPNGKVLDNYYGLDLEDWGCVFSITENNEVVMCRQYRHGLKNVFLELPCGIIEKGEDSAVGSRREMEEETGYKTDKELIFLGKVNPSPAKFNNWNYCYLATDSYNAFCQNLDDTEQIEVVLVPVSELKSKIKAGEIVDSYIISCIFLALDYLGLN